VNYVDPTGHYLESAWDLFSIGVGFTSVGYDIKQIQQTGTGWGYLFLDLFGLAVDIGALFVPIPGGASPALRAWRISSYVADPSRAIYASRIARIGYEVVEWGRRVDTAINLYQSGQSAVTGYSAYQQGDTWGAALHSVGAGFGALHIIARGGQLLTRGRWREIAVGRWTRAAGEDNDFFWHNLVENFRLPHFGNLRRGKAVRNRMAIAGNFFEEFFSLKTDEFAEAVARRVARYMRSKWVKRIHVDLTDISMTPRVWPGGSRAEGFVARLEVEAILRSEKLWSKSVFYEGGRRIGLRGPELRRYVEGLLR
jgi:hypothetical protein